MDFSVNFSKIEKDWIKKAVKLDKTIVLPEARISDRVLQAGMYCADNNIAKVVFLKKGDGDFAGLDLEKHDNVRVVDMRVSNLVPVLASALHIKRQEKGLTLKDAYELMKDPIWFATMMVELSLVDGSVSGAECTSAETFKPAFQVIKGRGGANVSSFFIMLPEKKNEFARPYVLADCAINLNPTAKELAQIGKQSAVSYKEFLGDKPKVAFLSYSTKGSGQGEQVDKIKQVIEILNAETLDFCYDGELQLDSAVVPTVAKLKNPKGKIQGDANVLIFPDLQSGNIGYKLMQRFGGYKAIGPIVQGLNKPINDVSRGASVDEIVLTIALTCLQN